jgi:hypothetical protein
MAKSFVDNVGSRTSGIGNRRIETRTCDTPVMPLQYLEAMAKEDKEQIAVKLSWTLMSLIIRWIFILERQGTECRQFEPRFNWGVQGYHATFF